MEVQTIFSLEDLSTRTPPEPIARYRNLKTYESTVTSRRDFIRMDANEGPSPPSEVLSQWLSQVAESLTRYPEYGDVQSAAAETFGVPIETVLPVDGADEGIRLVMKAFCPENGHILTIDPSFVMYETYARLASGNLWAIPTLESGEIDMVDLCRAMSESCMAVFASPNNPTGRTIPDHDLITLLESANGQPFLLDETYVMFSGNHQTALLGAFPNLIILRTLSKSYGVPGLRCGFVIAHPKTIETLRSLRCPYSVSATAAALGTKLLKNDYYASVRCAQAVKAAAWLRRELGKLGEKTEHSDTHFFIMRLGTDDARACAAFLRKNGLLVRVMEGRLEGALRISTATISDAEEFLQQFISWRGTKGGTA